MLPFCARQKGRRAVAQLKYQCDKPLSARKMPPYINGKFRVENCKLFMLYYATQPDYNLRLK
ncbi:MAG: hypothetical protein C0594_03980 [Marinilabiliales bacterium]|nr:MAG: hypothetical protein C0594_03980 [Marinilabiliales bacterium]